MDSLIHQVVAGLVSGLTYASLALALVMIYQSTNQVNFAQGEMAMFSTYIAWILVVAGWPYWVAFVATLAFSFLMGFAIERFILRPLGQAPVLSTVTVFVGLLAIFNSMAGWLFGHEMQNFPSPFPESWGNRYASGHEIGLALVIVIVLGLVFSFFRFTRLGLGMRGAAQNPVSSRLLGIPVDRLLALGWGLAAAVGAVAGMMAAPLIFIDPNMMSGILLYGFAAALLGGINNPVGAIPGGIIVGIMENLVGAYVVGTELKLTVALVLIIVILLVCPAGLFGRSLKTRV